ncbi:MAG: hypothetical protein OEQ18_01910 [Gammaproteobacteria bacterium]|nr:hypothetical protein [Gammaproteobacteria bacterium]
MKISIVLVFALVLVGCGDGSTTSSGGDANLLRDKGKGPRPSVSVATVCSVNPATAELVVKTTVRDKSSGGVIPGVSEVALTAVQKGTRDSRVDFAWSTASFDPAIDGEVNSEFMHDDSFSLCELRGDDLAAVKALNATAEVTYQDSDDPDPETRTYTVTNHCSDDPDTAAVEPSGIKVDDALRDAIAQACF